jgi:hypothetical protein
MKNLTTCLELLGDLWKEVFGRYQYDGLKGTLIRRMG